MARAANAPIFYGWWNVLASFVGLSLSYAMFTVFSFGVFVSPLQTEFDWARGPMSLALTIANITVVVASPLLGGLIDRIGARRVMVVSVALPGFCVASMGQLAGDIRHYYLMHILIPLLGAGTLPLAYSRIIVQWFEKHRGLALGIALSGFGFGLHRCAVGRDHPGRYQHGADCSAGAVSRSEICLCADRTLTLCYTRYHSR